jgi:hypothetical protein
VKHVAPRAAESQKESPVNLYFAQKRKIGRKSCQLADIGRRAGWTADLVAERLTTAFAAKHRALDNNCQKPTSAWRLVTSHEDTLPDLELGCYSVDKPKRLGEKNFQSQWWKPFDTPADSDYYQLCSKGATFGANNQFVLDHPKWRKRFNDGSDILKANGFKVEDGSPKVDEPDPDDEDAEDMTAREQEREDARQVAEGRKILRANPESFHEKAMDDLYANGRESYVVNDDLMALEAQGWIIRKMDGKFEADRLTTLAWLKSGLSVEKFFRRLKVKPIEGVEGVHSADDVMVRFRAYTSALAMRLNRERVPVKRIVRRLDYGWPILQGVGEIANYLHRSIVNTRQMLNAGLIPVATFLDGTVIASANVILHLRDHHKRPLEATSQAA